MVLNDSVYVFPDIVSPEIQENILNDHLGKVKYEFAATRKPQANMIKNPIDIDSIKIPGKKVQLRPGIFQSVFYEESVWNYKHLEVFGDLILAPLNNVAKKFDLEYTLMKIKSNFNYRDLPENKDTCFIPHCDFEGRGGWTLLYYINDSDGDTIIFKNKGINYLTLGKELEIRKSISPKKGTIIMFKQDYLHAGCPPITNDYRLVINYNVKMLNPVPEINSTKGCCK